MNVKLNKLVMEHPEVESLYVFPSCGDETNCIGCHQGMAVHGTRDKISDEDCFKCHVKDNKNAMIGKFHSADNSLSSITGFSIITQILILMILIFAVRFFIKPPGKSGKGKE